MTKNKWIQVEELTLTHIEPIFKKEGFERLTGPGLELDEYDGFFFMYERSFDQLRASVDALERSGYDDGQQLEFNWLRVDIGGEYLKMMLTPPQIPASQMSALEMHNADGWTYTTVEELKNAINEIVDMLKKYFDME